MHGVGSSPAATVPHPMSPGSLRPGHALWSLCIGASAPAALLRREEEPELIEADGVPDARVEARPDAAASTAGGDEAYLSMLGERVREARARRGMSRKILARDSGVSERYLAQLEGGGGNISVLLLRQIAQALGMPIVDLVREGADRPVELTLLLQFLGRLPADDLAAAQQLLFDRFSRIGRDERHNRIALIGLRGAGKSTLGSLLADRLGVPFIELNREIERVSQTSLTEIFSLYGQAAFRRYERRCLEAAIEGHDRCVIATGGSLVSEPATFNLLLSSCFSVWIKTSPEEHMNRVLAQGDTRPMRDNKEAMEDLRRILTGRASLYGKADASIDTSGRSVEQSLSELLAAVC